jgi:hypothetical protein
VRESQISEMTTSSSSNRSVCGPVRVCYCLALNNRSAKTFEDRHLDTTLDSINPLLTDPDRFKQRAGAEVLVGLLRGMTHMCPLSAHTENHHLGSKHWPKQKWDKLWTWTLDRIDQIFVQIKPDTLSFWKSVFSVSVSPLLGSAGRS